MRYKERPKPDNPDDILIPKSVLLRVFNRVTGAHCETVEETVAYLEEHPEARDKLRALETYRHPRKDKSPQ